MRTALLGLAAAILMSFSPSGLAADPTHPVLRTELLQMKERDQAVRKASTQEEFRKWGEIDAANRKRLKEIVDQHGWPSFAMVGEDGGRAAWLLAQHADQEPDFQRKVLGLMAGLVKQGQASAKDYAYLYDRTHYPQRFGTQGRCVSAEEWQPFEIEDIDNVDARRREAGMPSLSDYAAMFKNVCAQAHIAKQRQDEARRTVPVPQR